MGRPPLPCGIRDGRDGHRRTAHGPARPPRRRAVSRAMPGRIAVPSTASGVMSWLGLNLKGAVPLSRMRQTSITRATCVLSDPCMTSTTGMGVTATGMVRRIRLANGRAWKLELELERAPRTQVLSTSNSLPIARTRFWQIERPRAGAGEHVLARLQPASEGVEQRPPAPPRDAASRIPAPRNAPSWLTHRRSGWRTVPESRELDGVGHEVEEHAPGSPERARRVARARRG